MDLDIIMLSEVSQTEKDKYHMISLMYGILREKNLKKNEHMYIYVTQSLCCTPEINTL